MSDTHEIARLRERLREAEETLNAIRQGSVDALVVKLGEVQRVFTLESADYSYRVLVESMNQGALTISKDGIIVYSNKHVSVMLERPLEQIIGSSVTTVFQQSDAPKLNAFIRGVGPAVSTESLECTLASSGASVLLSATKLPVLEGGADVCLVITDISERKRAEEVKDEFIALASHQLRSPATAVKQYIGMLLQGYAGTIPENQKALLQTALSSNERELKIINDLLKTAQIDSGHYELKKTPLDVKNFITDTVAQLESNLQLKEQVLEVNVEPGLVLFADEADLVLALTNLIENASKYSSRKARIFVEAKRTESAWCVIMVRDEGIGMGKRDQKMIFNKFTRIKNDSSDAVTGNGLGLYWVKRIVERHGGIVEVMSRPREGTTFTLKFPVNG
jgi:PAS domain S-box-containing protein